MVCRTSRSIRPSMTTILSSTDAHYPWCWAHFGDGTLEGLALSRLSEVIGACNPESLKVVTWEEAAIFVCNPATGTVAASHFLREDNEGHELWSLWEPSSWPVMDGYWSVH